jgi:type II secretory pathway component PulK
MRRFHSISRSRRAMILVITLWVVMVLTIMAYSLDSDVRVETLLAQGARDQFLAEQVARIGIARACADLRNDRAYETTEDLALRMDAMGDVWAGSMDARSYDIDLNAHGYAKATYDFMVVDEYGKISLSAKNTQWRDIVAYMLQMLDVDDDESVDIANALWDWQDADDDLVNGEDGTEVEYYSKLAKHSEEGKSSVSGSGEEDAPAQVRPKNANFTSVDEILDVPGITPDLFYGYDSKKEEAPPFFPWKSLTGRDERMPGLRDLFTVGDTSLNVNTADYICLAAVCAEATGNLEDGKRMAKEIVDRRQGLNRDRVNNDTAFRELEGLKEVPDLTDDTIAALSNVVSLTTSSDKFTIYCEARLGSASHKILVSSRSKESDDVSPTARVVATCQRGFLVYDSMDYDGELPPGYGGDALATIGMSMSNEGNSGIWVTPTITLSKWIVN